MHIDARLLAKQFPGALVAPVFTDLDGQAHQRELPLSVLEYNALEADWQQFLADAAAGLITKENFESRVRPIVEGTGWPADRVLALPNELFWAVMSGFFASPTAEGQPPVAEATTPASAATTTPAASPQG